MKKNRECTASEYETIIIPELEEDCKDTLRKANFYGNSEQEKELYLASYESKFLYIESLKEKIKASRALVESERESHLAREKELFEASEKIANDKLSGYVWIDGHFVKEE